MAFVRRKGNAFYLVHNVRRGAKVRQLHLARLGGRAKITEKVIQEVAKKHPSVELDWAEVKEQVSTQLPSPDAKSAFVRRLVTTLRGLNVELADLFPPLLRISESPLVAQELLVQLRLLRSTVQVKLEQCERRMARFSGAQRLRPVR